MIDKIKFEDESGDKEFFTIIPNYILNHSTQCDRDVYIQIKRVAGENGECYMSRTSLAKQCGISVRRLDKSIKYLLDHGWIKDAGKKSVMTKGGGQLVNVYKVANIWKLNIKHYEEKYGDKGIAPKTPPIKGGAKNDTKGVHEKTKGGAPGAHKEEPYNNITIKEEHSNSTELQVNENSELNEDIKNSITYWKAINPLYKDWYGNKTQRGAIERILTDKEFNKDEFLFVIQNLKLLQEKDFCPRIDSPYFLLKNWSAVKAFIRKDLLKIQKDHEEKMKGYRFEYAQLFLIRDRTPQEEKRFKDLEKLLK